MPTSSFNKRRAPLPRLLRGVLFVTLFVPGMLFLLVVIWVRAMHHSRFRERLIQWNRRYLNPITLKDAGHHTSIYALLKHVGRHSGRTYMTPVVAKPLGDGFVIPLPYGAEVDWCRNVLEAGTCTLLVAEQGYRMEQPELLPLSKTGTAFSLFSRCIYRAGGIKQYMWLHQHKEGAEATATPEVQKEQPVSGK